MKNTEGLLDVSKKAGLQKRKRSTHLSLHQNAGQSHGTTIVSKPFENDAKFKYLGMTVKKSKIHS
jgi:hypothetical protein